MISLVQTPEVGKFVVIRVEGSNFDRYGTIVKVTPTWIRIEGYKNTRSGWIPRENLTACYTPSSLRFYFR